MNSVLSQVGVAPHLLPQNRLSPSRSFFSNSPNMNRKRKAEDDASAESDERMSASPSTSPSMSSRPFPAASSNRITKRMRTNLAGRPLSLPRLLETLTAEEMRNILQVICDRNPQIGADVVAAAPRPSVGSALGVLGQYEASLQTSFPFGGRNSSDYSYNRVRQALVNLLDALKDYTPHFLPPNETQAATSLTFLDGATEVIHRLPEWDNFQNNRHKQEAYEEMAKAWAAVIQEAAKRAGGIQLQYGGWDQKLNKHNQQSHGRMQDAVDALRTSLGWIGGDMNSGSASTSANANDPSSIRQQLLSGTYGIQSQVRVGLW
ncbi:tethering factor for nuclear proteasome STS1 [Pseudovirgaria hyperparasitica]|uniref:Tethering factor for nuclear proteasome STS1 n=1 Tax=Pseudovirgaria hyperparasitica TaxID=470096 RepID=A0A6A6WAX6_9PEZI|nr:tethering factor for nuclear proteasome STS1 [Pseudovirgaria hyperparasitica]KAF2759823.1 tethering factor for nuclear proteasome STS1 [Pseudovirgaria hyperparasitica]